MKDGFRWIGRGVVALYVGLFFARRQWPAIAEDLTIFVNGVAVLWLAVVLYTLWEELDKLKEKVRLLESKRTDTLRA